MRNSVKEIPASVMSLTKEAVKEFFIRSDISYTMSGDKDEMVVWDEFGKQQLLKYYLTMYICEVYAVFKVVYKGMKQCVACSLSPSLD